jgi:hypothetical protein
MFGRAKVLLTIAAGALAMPVFAQAPTTAFDGKYAGVSREVSKNPSAHRTNNCPQSGETPFKIEPHRADGVVVRHRRRRRKPARRIGHAERNGHPLRRSDRW